MKKIEVIALLVEEIEFAIKSGDWKVDGACDPDFSLSIAEVKLEQCGYTKESATGEWVKD